MGYEEIITKSTKLTSPFNADNAGAVNAYLKDQKEKRIINILLIRDDVDQLGFRCIHQVNKLTKDEWISSHGNGLIGRIRIDDVGKLQEWLDKDTFWLEKEDITDENVKAISEALDELISIAVEWNKKKMVEGTIDIVANNKNRCNFKVTCIDNNQYYIDFSNLDSKFRKWLSDRRYYIRVNAEGKMGEAKMNNEDIKKYCLTDWTEEEIVNGWTVALKKAEREYIKSIIDDI